MEASFDQSTSDMFKLLSSLNEKILPRRDFDSNALGGIPGPDIRTWITRTTVDGQKLNEVLIRLYPFGQTLRGRSNWELTCVACQKDIRHTVSK